MEISYGTQENASFKGGKNVMCALHYVSHPGNYISIRILLTDIVIQLPLQSSKLVVRN